MKFVRCVQIISKEVSRAALVPTEGTFKYCLNMPSIMIWTLFSGRCFILNLYLWVGKTGQALCKVLTVLVQRQWVKVLWRLRRYYYLFIVTGTPMHGYWNKYTTDTYNYNNTRRNYGNYPIIIKNERYKWHKDPNWYKYYTIWIQHRKAVN